MPQDEAEIPDLPEIEGAAELEVEPLPETIDEEVKEDSIERLVEDLMLRFDGYRMDERRVNQESLRRQIYLAYMGYKPKGGPFRNPYSIREIFRQVETLKPQICKQFFSSDRMFRYRPEVPGAEAEAEAATQIVHKQMLRDRIQVQLRQWIDCFILYGTSYLGYGWRKFKRTRFKIAKMHEAYKDKPVWQRSSEEIPAEGPYVECYKPWEVFSDPGIEDPRNSPCVFIWKASSINDLKTLVREGWLDADAVERAVDTDKGGMSGPATMEVLEQHPADKQINTRLQDLDELVEMHICWTNDGWEYVVLNREHLVRAMRLPLGEIPILCQRNYPQPDEHFGIPEPLVILDEQRFINDLASMWIEQNYFACVPMVKVAMKERENWMATGFRPGGAVYLNDPAGGVVPFDMPNKSMDIQSAIGALLRNAQVTSGVTPELDGTGSSSKTATAHVRLQDAAGVRMAYKTQLLMPGFVELFERLYMLNAANLDEEVTVAMEGEDGRQAFQIYGPTAFAETVEVELTNVGETGPEQMQKWMQMVQVLGQNPTIKQELLIERLLRASGEKKPSAWIQNPALAPADAMRENANWKAQGLIGDPSPSDDHATHLQIHQMLAQTPEFAQIAMMHPQAAAAMAHHLQIHQLYVEAMQKQQEQAAQTSTEMMPGGPQMPEAEQRTEATFSNGMTGAAQQGQMQGEV